MRKEGTGSLTHLYVLSYASKYPKGYRDTVNAFPVPFLNPSPNPDFKSVIKCHGNF